LSTRPRIFDTMEHTIEIPDELVGLVIGRRGAGLQRITMETRAKVSLPREKNAAGKRELVITGTPDQCAQAEYLVQQQLSQQPGNRKRGREPHEAPNMQGQLPGTVVSPFQQQLSSFQPQVQPQTFLQPPPQLMQSGGASMFGSNYQMFPEQMLPFMPSVPLSKRANVGSRMLPVGSSWAAPNGGDVPCRLLIDGSLCGLIIGKGGAGLKAIKDTSGANCSIEKGVGYGNARLTVILGSTDSQKKALSMVCEHLCRKGRKKGDESGPEPQLCLQMLFPASKGGLIIGKGGTGLKTISAECGVKLEAQRENIGMERILGVTGHPEAVSTAICAVLASLSRTKPRAAPE